MSKRVENPFGPSEVAATAAARPAPASDTASPGNELGLRELTGFEEEYIERHRHEANTARLCNEVLARCLVAPGADPGPAREQVRALLVAERDRALIQLRRISLGDTVETRVQCPSCHETNQADFALSSLPTAFKPAPQRLSIELDDGRTATMRLPTAGDQADLLDAGIEGDAHRRSWLLARVLLRLGDDDELDIEAVRALPVRTRRLLEQGLARAVPELDLSMSISCHSCGHEFSAPFDVAAFFFRS